MISRRQFLAAAAASPILLLPPPLRAIPPIQRTHSRIKGLSLSSYSLRTQMRYWTGRTTQGTMDMLGFIDYCAELGLEGAELTSYFFETPVKPAFLNQIKRRAHLLGLDLTSGAIGNSFSHPPGSEKANTQSDYVRTWIDHFADMGIPAIRVFAGQPQGGTTAEQAIDNIRANLDHALSHAQKRGVILGMENHDFTSNVDRLLSVVKKIDSEWFGIVLDSGNLGSTPDPYAELSRLAPYAVLAQIKVMIPVNGKGEEADFGRIVELLRAAGYAGYLVLEYEEKEDPFKAIPRHIHSLRKALG